MSQLHETEFRSSHEKPETIRAIAFDLWQEISHLLHSTLQLVTAETQQKADQLISGLIRSISAIGIGLIGISFALVSLNALLVSLLAPDVMSENTAQWVVPLFIGLITAAVGYMVYKAGMKQMKRFDPRLKKTAQSIQNNKDWIVEKTQKTS